MRVVCSLDLGNAVPDKAEAGGGHLRGGLGGVRDGLRPREPGDEEAGVAGAEEEVRIEGIQHHLFISYGNVIVETAAGEHSDLQRVMSCSF